MTPRIDLDALLSEHQTATDLKYGTAGFRGPADTLPSAMLRCGVLAALRSFVHDSQATGVMVTASHNPAPDNGVKLVDPDGSMLAANWESVATPFVNAKTNPLSSLSDLVDVDAAIAAESAVVVIGCDTRDSSPGLVDLVVKGVQAVGAKPIRLGVVTTPQLHIAVRSRSLNLPCEIPDYFSGLADGFVSLVGKKGVSKALTSNLVVDCANGVGASAMDGVKHLLPGVSIINKPNDGLLNDKCGADFVQKKRVMPTVYGDTPDAEFWASLDGDADRLVLFHRQENCIILADGDRFAALVAKFVSKHLKIAKVSDVTVAVAQTAYSNGAATEFISSMQGVEVVIAKTGVKHLEKAVKPFDVGIYWEPNGHGTVLFAEKTLKAISDVKESVAGDKSLTEQVASLDALLALSKVANQAVGDGVADLLAVIGIMSLEDMTFQEWLQLYDERCSSNMVVHVKDKNVIETADCDRLVEKPDALKDAVAKIANGAGCRAFVRPSGTEDVVRVYAEAPVGCEGKAKEMSVQISQAVFDHCGGVGERAE